MTMQEIDDTPMACVPCTDPRVAAVLEVADAAVEIIDLVLLENELLMAGVS